ncbi:hypothetical protein HYU92_00770 [Candidatus Curtissbacteria bacterium]|nr:hypothetical protein [Candidatus Curtissbacteria bacterium]
MDYITTNVRFHKEEYMRLKEEAARTRKSFSAIVREKVRSKRKKLSKAEVDKIMAETEKLAREIGKYTKGFDSVKALREIRYHDR